MNDHEEGHGVGRIRTKQMMSAADGRGSCTSNPGLQRTNDSLKSYVLLGSFRTKSVGFKVP